MIKSWHKTDTLTKITDGLLIVSLVVVFIFLTPPVPLRGESIISANPEATETPLNSTLWQIGLSRKIITPQTEVWLAGYGTKRVPEGKIHDLWVKVLALKDPQGKRHVLVTSDHQGMSKTISLRLQKKIENKYGIPRPAFMLTFSHNHSGPCLEDDLVDYYPSDEAQRKLVKEYTLWMEDIILEAVGEALSSFQPAILSKGEEVCTFAVNRRENKEAEVPELIQKGIPLKGPVDHSVPVLSVRSPEGRQLAVLFGYACHPTTLSHTIWSGDYPGFAQLEIEKKFPGTQAMFFNTCGGDQNPLPRRTVELCEKYGRMLADAVSKTLRSELTPLSPALSSAFDYVKLEYEEVVTREKLLPFAAGNAPIQARWAGRMLKKIDEGETFLPYYEYPVQIWNFGSELSLIALGGEAVVDYALTLKKHYPKAWVCGYANEMAAYIPSRRVWEEGGYEGGPHLDEYGLPAWRWKGDIENRILAKVNQLISAAETP